MEPQIILPDYVLAEYIFLQQEIKALEKKLETMKVTLKQYGSFTTENYMCAVSKQARTQLKPLKDIIALVGTEVLNDLDLITVHNFEVIKVVKKSHPEP